LTVESQKQNTCLSPYALHVENGCSEKLLNRAPIEGVYKPLIRAAFQYPGEG